MKISNKSNSIVFWGTSSFGVPILEALIGAEYEITAIITKPDKPSGRQKILTPPPIKAVAKQYNIPVFQPVKMDNEARLKIQNFKPNLFIVAAYGKIIPKEILDLPKFGAINTHPSLLPKYRGPSPIETALLNGEQKTGTTIMLMDREMDHGHVLASAECAITEKDNYKTLHDKLASLSAKLLTETLSKWLNNKIYPAPQDHSKATFTKLFKTEDGKINWSQSAQNIHNQTRALGSNIGVFTIWTKPKNHIILKIHETELSNFTIADKKIGEVFLSDKNLAVMASDKPILIKQIQPEGRKIMPARDFLNGNQDIIGSILN